MTAPGSDFESPRTATSLIVRLAAERLAHLEPDLSPDMGDAGPRNESPADRVTRVGLPGRPGFLDKAAEALGDPLLGFHLAQDYDLRALGPLYYLLVSSETVGNAFALCERFSRILDEAVQVVFRMSGTAMSVGITLDGVERHADRHRAEFWMLSILRLVRSLTSLTTTPLSVGFVHQNYDDVTEMETCFGVKVDFGRSEDRIDFDVQTADIRPLTFDPYLQAYLVRYLTTGSEHWAPTTLGLRVKNAMTPRLARGTVTTATIASDLGMSTRTLSRRLSQEGKTFNKILDELRAELAARYIKVDALPISEIAWLLGYREASAIVVAFRRWTGMSPTEVRRRHTASSR